MLSAVWLQHRHNLGDAIVAQPNDSTLWVSNNRVRRLQHWADHVHKGVKQDYCVADRRTTAVGTHESAETHLQGCGVVPHIYDSSSSLHACAFQGAGPSPLCIVLQLAPPSGR